METTMGFWGVAVRPGETVMCDPPGEFYYHISQIALEPGELNENVQVFGEVDGDESDEEVPLAIPLFPNSDDDKIKEVQNSPSKFATLKSAAAASPTPEAIVEERKNYGKSEADDDDSDEESDASGEDEYDDDEDMIDKQDSSDDDGDSSDEEETPSKNTKGTNRHVETPLNTPPQKRARLATPIMDSKAGTGKRSGYVHVATPYPAKQAKKTPVNNDMAKQSSGYVHVATPYPAKQAKKRTANNDMSEHSAGYACKPCNKTFNTSMGLEAHSKAKHTATK
ncbi:hypothetical protein OsI_04861 [Oryza sativa Indica Group]|uniref:C2H2-type domain-containing protein n=1 Tax=Oryza sativa subsp. indica TaxID=39946 RepID=B8A861_ORYSI|nr:hypothetical protein OsI_04861 [Oryza sativa Indica Group]